MPLFEEISLHSTPSHDLQTIDSTMGDDKSQDFQEDLHITCHIKGKLLRRLQLQHTSEVEADIRPCPTSREVIGLELLGSTCCAEGRVVCHD